MILYNDPNSTTCRPVRLFLADHHVAFDSAELDLMRGDHRAAEFAALNPNRAVPVLDVDGWTLAECSAILKYLAARIGSPTYPVALEARAEIDAAMDWFNTGFYRDFGYNFVYPQVLPDYVMPKPEAQQALLARGATRSRRWLDILDRHMLAGRAYVVGDQPSIADYLGVGYATLGDWIGFDFSPWPNVSRWVERMRARPACAAEWARYEGWVAAMRAGSAEAALTA